MIFAPIFFMKHLLILVLVFAIVPYIMGADKLDLLGSSKILDNVKSAALERCDLETNLHSALQLEDSVSLKLVREISDNSKHVYHRYQMMYNNIPVWGEQIVLSETDGMPCHLHGQAVYGIENDVPKCTPAFDSAEALAFVKKHTSCEKHPLFYDNETAELVIYLHENVAKLAYHVTFFADTAEGGHPQRPVFIIDAQTKEILEEYNNLNCECCAVGPGGNAKTGMYRYGEKYDKLDVKYDAAKNISVMEKDYVKTINLNHTSGYGSYATYSFEGKENTYKEINEAYCPLNDAHYFGNIVFRLYKEWYNTAPLTFKLVMRVHYSNSYENAFWNGSSMTFGDGKSRFFPLVCLDVAAHEVSHGFTSQNSNLAYRGQSGGINEAFSDIAGEAAEYFMNGENDWQIGAQIFKQQGALRYMDDPTRDGKSIGSAKDFTSSMNVHQSSGVFNKAFYLLAHRPGWNTRKAFDVFLKANQVYWTSSSNFVQAATGVLHAAKDLGYNTADVIAAFAGVDVEIAE